jgi:hypothetical protein
MKKATRYVLMVEERGILFGIKHLQERTRRVPINPSSNFVNFIKHNKRVLGSHTLEGLDDLARKRSDIGSSMTLDLRHIGQSAYGEPEELPSECAGDGFTNTRLANARWSNEAKDLAFDCSAELAYCDEFEDAVLNVFQTVVVLVEYLDGMLDGIVLRRVAAPRNL